MPRCAFKGCKNDNKYHKISSGVSYFCFPTDPFRSAEWSRIVEDQRRDGYKSAKGSVICSDHFKDTDIIGNMKRRRLSKTANPTEKIPPVCSRYATEQPTFDYEDYEDSSSQSQSNPLEQNEDQDQESTQIDQDEVSMPNEQDEESEQNEQDEELQQNERDEESEQNEQDEALILHLVENKECNQNNTQPPVTEIDSVFTLTIPVHETPGEKFLKKKLEKSCHLITNMSRKIRILQKRNKRLEKRNKLLKNVITGLKGLISQD